MNINHLSMMDVNLGIIEAGKLNFDLPPGSQLAQEKLFYERFYALHRDPSLLKIFEKFGIKVFRRSSVLEGLAEFLIEHKIKGRRCVEIGTCYGLTAIVLSRHFDEVVTIDIADNFLKQHIADYAGALNVCIETVADNAEKAALIGGLDFDFAYVDGDHTHDTETDFALVCDCGRVLFHEYWEAQPPVWNLIERLRGQGHVETKGKLALWTKAKA